MRFEGCQIDKTCSRVKAETSSYTPPEDAKYQHREYSHGSGLLLSKAICPGRVSVGTRVCEIPRAPLDSATPWRKGATSSGEPGMSGYGLRSNTTSARSPSTTDSQVSHISCSTPSFGVARLDLPTKSTRRFASLVSAWYAFIPCTISLLK